MASTGTRPVGGPPTTSTTDPSAPEGRRIRRPRSLPGGRAVVGALLVAVSVVGVVAAHVSATAAPDTRYLVAAVDVPAGTLLGDEAAVERRFESLALDLPDALAGRAVPLEDAASLVGRRTLAGLRAGDLVLDSVLLPEGRPPGRSTFSFALPPAAAAGGQLAVGEHIDVVATVGTGSEATTAYVVRAAPLVAVTTAGDASGLGGDAVQLTVALDDQRTVQALAHALATATVVVVASPDEGAEVPAPYRFGDRLPGEVVGEPGGAADGDPAPAPGAAADPAASDGPDDEAVP